MIEKLKDLKLPFTNKQLVYIFHITLLIIFSYILLASYKHGNLDYWKAMKKYGEIAWYLLIYTIFSSLVFKLFKEFKIIQQAFLLRKWAGIAVFYFAFLHLFFYFLNNGFNFDYLIYDIKNNPISYISGLFAFIILIPLFITSAKFIKKIIDKKKWFILHKLTHLVFILVAIHIAFIEFNKYENEIEFEPFILLFLYFSGYTYLYYKRKNN